MNDLLPVHSPLGGSAAARFIACPGSASLIQRLGRRKPSLDPDYARHGQTAHEVVAACLQQSCDVWEVMDRDWNGITFEPDETSSMQDYLDFVRQRVKELNGLLHIEFNLARPEIHPLFYGTLDVGIVAGSHAEIIDYKHGAGIPVDAYENPQLRYYAAGFLYDMHEVETVSMWIVQPRSPMTVITHYKEPTWELLHWVESVLVPAMWEADPANGSLQLNPGEHCRFCPAKLHCPAIKQELVVVSDVQKVPQDATPEELGGLLERIPRARMLIKAVEEEALRRMLDGVEIPGQKLVAKKTNRVWKEGAEKVMKLHFGEDAFERTLKSPARMEVLFGAEGLVKDYAFAPDGGPTMAPVSDSRKAIPVKRLSADYPLPA